MLAATSRSRSLAAALTVLVAAAVVTTPFGVRLSFSRGSLHVVPCSGAASANPGPEDPDETAGLPSIELILARYIEVIGGAEAVASLKTRVATMHCITDLPSRTPPVYDVDTLFIQSVSTGEYLVVDRTSRGVVTQGFDGEEAWKIDVDGKAFDFDARGSRDRWMTDPQFPIKLTSYFPDMELVGVRNWDGAYLYIVDIDGDESHWLGFEMDTGLLTRVGYHHELRDYREVDGVLIPHRVIYGRKGGSSTFFIDSIEHNTLLDRSIFSLAK